MATQIHGADQLRARLRRMGPAILPALGAPLSVHAAQVSSAAAAAVPRDDGALAASAFVDGPEVNAEAMSVTATVGYDADHAPFVHEGFHYGRKISAPPKWLENAAAGREDDLARDVASTILSELQRFEVK